MQEKPATTTTGRDNAKRLVLVGHIIHLMCNDFQACDQWVFARFELRHKICCRTGTCEPIFVSDADGTRSKIICEPPREERDCTMPACPIDCVFNDWADWWGISVLIVSHLPTKCPWNHLVSKEERTRAVMTPASGGGKPCDGATWTFLDPAIFGTLL